MVEEQIALLCYFLFDLNHLTRHKRKVADLLLGQSTNGESDGTSDDKEEDDDDKDDESSLMIEEHCRKTL